MALILDLAHTDRDWRHIYHLCIGFVNPRPIALTATRCEDGTANLAPFSFYNMVCANPPVLMLSIGQSRSKARKDTLRNVQREGEFVVATVTQDFAQAMVDCAAELDYGASEFAFSGLTPAPALRVRAPLVAQAKVNVECRLRQILPIGDDHGGANLILGDVLVIHVDDAVLDGDGLIDPHKLPTVGRLGGTWYANVTAPYSMRIPAAK